MRHRLDERKLGRTTSHRKAMLANMVSSLIFHDRIETTIPKAKEARRLAEKMVTFSKKGTIHARRRALELLRNPKAVDRAFEFLGKRFEKRDGGYTRIYRLGFRNGDSAPMAVLEYLKEDSQAAKKDQKKKEK